MNPKRNKAILTLFNSKYSADKKKMHLYKLIGERFSMSPEAVQKIISRINNK